MILRSPDFTKNQPRSSRGCGAVWQGLDREKQPGLLELFKKMISIPFEAEQEMWPATKNAKFFFLLTNFVLPLKARINIKWMIAYVVGAKEKLES